MNACKNTNYEIKIRYQNVLLPTMEKQKYFTFDFPIVVVHES